LEAGDIARVEDAKTHKRALDMVTEAIRRRNVKSGIVYYRYKVCSRYGHIDKTVESFFFPCTRHVSMYLRPGIVILSFVLSHGVLFLLVSSAIDVATADGIHAK
jgi:hypothetical protein